MASQHLIYKAKEAKIFSRRQNHFILTFERSKKVAGKRKNSLLTTVVTVIVAIVATVFGFNNGKPKEVNATDSVSQSNTQRQQSASTSTAKETLIYFLDVGQGDSELIRLKTGENILIDAGTKESEKELVSYIKELGVSKIDYLIATHPHADHIGGMAQVVKQFDIGKIYMPKIPDKQVPTTVTYEKLLTEIDKKGLKITAAKAGMTIFQNGTEKFEILAPVSTKYDGLNSYSVVTKLTCGGKKFLFTGDAETDSEKDMISKNCDVKSDVLKCGHHGSSTSTSTAFLKAVNPTTAVISCGVDNDYGHPNKKILNRLENANVKVYRTDSQNTILAKCDGSSINITENLKPVIKK